jgi:hypothetical protein
MLRAHHIDQGAARHLQGQRDKPANSEDETDIALGPGVRGQVDGDERPEPGLDVGKEEGEPIEPAQARARVRGCAVGSGARCCRLTVGLAAAAPIERKIWCED